jgi:hypothetical protein
MVRATLGKRYFAVILVLGLPLALSAGYAASMDAKANMRLQEVADNAALAGVNSLATNSDEPAEARSAAAIAAARSAIAEKSGLPRILSPSVDGLTMSVTVEDADKAKRASATARYVPPKDGKPAREASNSPNQSASDNLLRARL